MMETETVFIKNEIKNEWNVSVKFITYFMELVEVALKFFWYDIASSSYFFLMFSISPDFKVDFSSLKKVVKRYAELVLSSVSLKVLYQKVSRIGIDSFRQSQDVKILLKQRYFCNWLLCDVFMQQSGLFSAMQ